MRNFRIFIPARLNSSRLPSKLLLRACGKAIILHTVDAAQKAAASTLLGPYLQGVYVLTDSVEIKDTVEEYCCKMCYPVSCVYSEHKSGLIRNGSDRIGHHLWHQFMRTGCLAVNWQADEPLLKVGHIASLVNGYNSVPACDFHTLIAKAEVDGSGAECVSPVLGVSRVFHVNSESSKIHTVTSFARSIGGPFRHIGVYAGSEDAFRWYAGLKPTRSEIEMNLEQMRVLDSGGRINASEVEYDGVPIDTEEDFGRFCEIVKNM